MPWKKRVSETGKGNRKNIILTMKNLRMQEVDSEQAGRRDDAVWETTCDTEDPYTVESEDFTEDEDYGEYPEGDDLDDFDEGDGIASGSGHG